MRPTAAAVSPGSAFRMGPDRRTKRLSLAVVLLQLQLLNVSVPRAALSESAAGPGIGGSSIFGPSDSSWASPTIGGVAGGAGIEENSLIGAGNTDDLGGEQHSAFSGSSVGGGENGRCEEITISMCRGIGYNLTSMPNEFKHDTQDEAGLEMHYFWPLVEIKCSPDLKFFLCSMYAPICIPEYTEPLPACKSVCERARSGCAPLMQQYGFSWPEQMACERLPNQGDPDHLCMEQDKRTSSAPSNASVPAPPRPTSPLQTTQPPRCKSGKNQKNCQHPPGDQARDCACRCMAPLVPLGELASAVTTVTAENHGHHGDGYESGNGSNASASDSGTPVSRGMSQDIAGVPNCALPCHGAFLTTEERDFAAVWLALWSGLCAVSTLLTIITFLIDTQRFKYPERPIVFLSVCYFVVSLGYLARSFVGHEAIVCDGAALRSGSHTLCVTVFLMIYFFGMASSAWSVVLSFTLFLATGLKWGNEAIATYSQYFHLVAWLVPTVQTIWALVSGGMAGDPIAGVCTVAPEGVRTFILAPLLVYLLLSASFLLSGFVRLFRIRSVIKRQSGAEASKLEKLMIRIGVFLILYVVPASAVLVCHLYESTIRDEWLRSLACPCHHPRARPLYSVLMLKYFMALAVGITSGVWILSGKTLDSWRRLWWRLFGTGMGGGSGDDGGGSAGAGMIGGAGIESAPILGRGGSVPPVGSQNDGMTGASSALLLSGSVASASQHHLDRHVLKQPYSTAPHIQHNPHSSATVCSGFSLPSTIGSLTPAHDLVPSYTHWRRRFGTGMGASGGGGGCAGTGMTGGVDCGNAAGMEAAPMLGRGGPASPVGSQHGSTTGASSALLPPGSVVSASQHHLNHYVLEQPHSTASHTPHTPHSLASTTWPLPPAHDFVSSYTKWRRPFGTGIGGCAGAGMIGGVGCENAAGMEAVPMLGRGGPVPPVGSQHGGTTGTSSALLPQGSVANASQHHLYHHVLEQPHSITSHTPYTPLSLASTTGPLTSAHDLVPSCTQWRRLLSTGMGGGGGHDDDDDDCNRIH